MPLTNGSFTGKIEGSGAGVNAGMLLKVYSGMVISALDEMSVTDGRFIERTISSGVSAQFPVFGRTSGKVHTIFESVLTDSYGQQEAHDEIVITLERPFITVNKVDEFEMTQAHYPVIQEYAHMQAQAISEHFDNKRLRALAAGAFQANLISGLASGFNLAATTGFASGTSSADISATVGAFFDAKGRFDAHRVPQTGRMAFMNWDTYNYLIKLAANQVIDMDITGGQANGSVATGTIKMLAGWELRPTNNFTFYASATALTGFTQDLPAGIGGGNWDDYAVPTTDIGVILGHRTSLGTLSLGGFGGVSTDSWYDPEYQARVMLARKSAASRVLRPEACGVIRRAASVIS
jgi:hypothetical protein